MNEITGGRHRTCRERLRSVHAETPHRRALHSLAGVGWLYRIYHIVWTQDSLLLLLNRYCAV